MASLIGLYAFSGNSNQRDDTAQWLSLAIGPMVDKGDQFVLKIHTGTWA